MHEEPYAQALLDMALERADGRVVTRMVIAVGRFSAVDPASLEIFFRHLSRGTPAMGAVLVFETVPVELTCKACHAARSLDIPLDLQVQPALAAALGQPCPCGGSGYSVTGGLGFDLLRLEVERRAGSEEPVP
jgi:Zn finger protein HypA/HybF involved in hydrogenase expression